MALLEAGLSLERAHVSLINLQPIVFFSAALQMGVFTELSVLYSKYRPEKRKYIQILALRLAPYRNITE
jgi:hypothetical protein